MKEPMIFVRAESKKYARQAEALQELMNQPEVLAKIKEAIDKNAWEILWTMMSGSNAERIKWPEK